LYLANLNEVPTAMPSNTMNTTVVSIGVGFTHGHRKLKRIGERINPIKRRKTAKDGSPDGGVLHFISFQFIV